MKKLKIILQSKLFIIISLILILIFILFKTIIIKYNSVYEDENYILGTIVKYEIKNDKLKIYLESKEKIIATYYTEEIPKVSIGDTIAIEGKLNKPINNTIPNTFNYKKYLYNHHIYKTFTIKELQIKKHSNNIFIKLKDFIYKRCNQNNYLSLFIIGDKSLLDSETYNNYKNIGVAHLLAVSGMHVSVFILILSKLLFFVPKRYRELFISFFLLFYAYLIGFTASILRVTIFYIIGRIIPEISNLKRLYLTFIIMVLIDPFYVYDIGFIYSFTTVGGIILISKYLNKGYLKDLIIISFYSLLFTLPITVSLNYEISILSIISNLIFIPIVTFLIYPLSLITFIIPKILPVYIFFTGIMEKILNIFSSILFTINIPKIGWVGIIIYYVILISSVYLNNYKILFFIIPLLIINKLSYVINPNYEIYYLDVGQGDSSIIIYPYHKQIILIDTGGKENYHVSDNTILFLKSIGITNVSKMILTHGDFDHMGDSENILNKIKVQKVYFNCGILNDLEQNLIDVLNDKKIKYEICHNFNDNLVTLDTKIYDEENDNSTVLLLNAYDSNFLFMGDAGVKKEEDILTNYYLNNINFIKIGHHGSNTSSSKEFINSINPRYSLISVGKNNRYGHPKKEVLDTLKNSKIYRTDLDGSIEIKLNKNGYKIRTCPP